MPEKYHISSVTFQITIALFFLHESCVHAAFLSDYDTLLQKLLVESDELPGSRPKRLGDQDGYQQNDFGNTKLENALISKLEEILMPQSIERRNAVPPDIENKRFHPEIVEKAVSKPGLSIAGTHDSQPVLSNLLTIIDRLSLPEYRTVTESVVKRNGWGDNSVFDSLMQAAYRLGELEVEQPKVHGQRFHAWGG